jgi:meso-butanediol dehydrogenase / (S,S)-butanediol dehydrogenase / diacetyl reductase
LSCEYLDADVAGVGADAPIFLLSDMARFITGRILPVSGGAELGYRR